MEIWYCNIRIKFHVNITKILLNTVNITKIECHFNVTIWHYILYVDIVIYNPRGFNVA